MPLATSHCIVQRNLSMVLPPGMYLLQLPGSGTGGRGTAGVGAVRLMGLV